MGRQTEWVAMPVLSGVDPGFGPLLRVVSDGTTVTGRRVSDTNAVRAPAIVRRACDSFRVEIT